MWLKLASESGNDFATKLKYDIDNNISTTQKNEFYKLVISETNNLK